MYTSRSRVSNTKKQFKGNPCIFIVNLSIARKYRDNSNTIFYGGILVKLIESIISEMPKAAQNSQFVMLKCFNDIVMK